MSKRFIYLLSLLLVTAMVCPAQTVKKPDIQKEHKAVSGRKTNAKKRKVVVTPTVAPQDTLVVHRVEEVKVSQRPTVLTDSCLLSWVNFLTPAQDKKNANSVEGSIVLDYSHGQKSKYDNRNFYEAMYKLQSVLHQMKSDPAISIKSVNLIGYTAPDGNYRVNEKMGMQRSLGLTDYIRSSGSLESIPFEVNWVAEDWKKVTQLVEQSEMPFKAAVLDIIHTVDVVNGREVALMNLAGGSPYQYLKAYIFPQVRRIDYVIGYDVKKRVGPGNKISYADMSLNDFYNMAQSHERGSAEFNDLLDLAGRLFPDSPEACINAAAVALSKRDTERARGYLMKFSTLPEAGNNMGILYLLEGNADKAEVYLELARAAGVKQAAESLKYINIVRR
ncbi:tetratricopeptide repeat protein [Bacteroides sp.]